MIRFFKIVRYNEWFDSKWNIYFYVFLLFLIRHMDMANFFYIKALTAIMAFSFFLLAFGYAFNEFSDTKEDLLAGKTNHIAQLSKTEQHLFILGIFTVGTTLPILLFPYLGMIIIVFVSFLMAFIYSYRQFGIKQCGLLGLAVSSLAQRVCPMFAIFYIFEDWTITAVLVALLSFIIGLRWILIHQAEDLGNDKLSHTKTFVISLNNESKLIKIVTSAFICEILSLVTILILNVRFSLALIIPFTYLAFQLFVLPFWRKIGWKRMILSYDFAPLADFYYLWSGIYLAMALTLRYYFFSLLFFPTLYFGYRYLILDYKYVKMNNDANKGILTPPKT